MKNEFFEELKKSMEQGLEHAQGKRSDLRTAIVPKPPQKMEGKKISALRKRLNQSQAVFARGLNVSVKTIQAWEAGTRNPDNAALKLLSIAEEHPDIVFGK